MLQEIENPNGGNQEVDENIDQNIEQNATTDGISLNYHSLGPVNENNEDVVPEVPLTNNRNSKKTRRQEQESQNDESEEVPRNEWEEWEEWEELPGFNYVNQLEEEETLPDTQQFEDESETPEEFSSKHRPGTSVYQTYQHLATDQYGRGKRQKIKPKHIIFEDE